MQFSKVLKLIRHIPDTPERPPFLKAEGIPQDEIIMSNYENSVYTELGWKFYAPGVLYQHQKAWKEGKAPQEALDIISEG